MVRDDATRAPRRIGIRMPIATAAMLAVAAVALSGVTGAQSADKSLGLSVDADRYAGLRPFDATFTPAVRDAAGAVRYHWCFDDGTKSDVQSPTHSFRRAGYYTVIVQAVDESGTRARQSVLIGAWPPKQWAAAQTRPITKRGAIRAQRAQQRRTRSRHKRLRLQHGLTLPKCAAEAL